MYGSNIVHVFCGYPNDLSDEMIANALTSFYEELDEETAQKHAEASRAYQMAKMNGEEASLEEEVAARSFANEIRNLAISATKTLNTSVKR